MVVYNRDPDIIIIIIFFQEDIDIYFVLNLPKIYLSYFHINKISNKCSEISKD